MPTTVPTTNRHLVPDDWPVQPLDIDDLLTPGAAQCGHCGRVWNDGHVTSMTPTPSGRCPFEYFHLDDRGERYLTLVEEEFDGFDRHGDPLPGTEDNGDDCAQDPGLETQRYALVETSSYGQTWITLHDTPQQALGAHINQEHADDWQVWRFVDLDTGEDLDLVRLVTAVDSTEIHVETAWHRQSYIGETMSVDAAHELLRSLVRDHGDQNTVHVTIYIDHPEED